MLFLLSQDENDPRLYSASLAFKNITDDNLASINSDKFQILEILEKLAYTALSEKHNDDACSFSYHFDTQHATDPIITASITEYLS
jgi:hypothetical protein